MYRIVVSAPHEWASAPEVRDGAWMDLDFYIEGYDTATCLLMSSRTELMQDYGKALSAKSNGKYTPHPRFITLSVQLPDNTLSNTMTYVHRINIAVLRDHNRVHDGTSFVIEVIRRAFLATGQGSIKMDSTPSHLTIRYSSMSRQWLALNIPHLPIYKCTGDFSLTYFTYVDLDMPVNKDLALIVAEYGDITNRLDEQ